MNSKKIFSRFVFFTFFVLLLSGFFLPWHYNMPYPDKLGPVFDTRLKRDYIRIIEQSQPDLILLGDSTLAAGVDSKILSEELEIPIYQMATPGSGTAAWYLQMKNIVFEAKHKPKYIVLFFRNTILTVPQYRTTGRYFFLLDDYAIGNEPLVTELSFVNLMSPLEKFAELYVPLYTARIEIREDLDNALRYIPVSLLTSCDRECTNQAVNSIFDNAVDSVALNLVLEDAAKTLYAPEEMDFPEQVEDSLLPHIIELLQKNNVHLILVRTKIYGPEPLQMANYNQALSSYLENQKNVSLIDFSNDLRILKSYYVDSLHINATGKFEFTKILAEELNKIISEK